MDPQYSLTSREEIWRVFEEVRDIYATQVEHGERISRLERRRDDDSRLRSFWGPWSPLPMAVGGAMQPESSCTPAADAFKGFDQGQQQGLMNNNGLEGEEEPRRGASRANSVRFDESAIHGYYGQNRSSSELPLRTGSGMDSHPLTERSLSHRSDGRLSSSGHSHHSARTNSLGIEGSRLIPSASGSPSNITVPPPGLFLLGPLPCIIRCWLTTSFSNDSLLYAAVCSGSYSSFLGFPMIEKLGLEEQIAQEGNMRCIKLRLYLPEASIHQASSRASSPTPQLPTLTIRFLVRETDPSDKSIQILIGSDVLRSHNADILFSQEKIIMIDDERKKVSIPLVRPENDSAFKTLSTASEVSRPASSAGCNGNEHPDTNGDIAGVIAPPPVISPQKSPTSATLQAAGEAFDGIDKPPSTHSEADHDDSNSQSTHTKSVADSESTFATPAKQENAGVWGSWRRDSKLDSNAVGMARSTRGRSMKVLRPSKSMSSRVAPGTSSNTSAVSDVVFLPAADSNRQPRQLSPINPPETMHPTPSRSASLNSGDSSWSSKQRSANPVGGASAFGWLNSSSQAKRPTGNE